MSKSVGIQFSKHLYHIDEVILCLISSILKSDVNEAIFWTVEYYDSGYQNETINLLFRIYYDYFACYYPKLEEFIRKKIGLWRENKDKIGLLLSIIKNLCAREPNDSVFNLRQNYYIITTGGKSITGYRGRKPEWCKKYPTTYQNILRSVESNNDDLFCYYLSKVKDDNLTQLYLMFITYYKTNHSDVLVSCDNNYFKEYWNQITSVYYDKRHIMLSLYLHMQIEENEIQEKGLFNVVKKKELAYLDKLIKSDEIVSGSAWKIMKEFRQFDVNTHKEFIRQFSIKSDSDNEEILLDNLRNNWLWFTKNVPIWSARIAEYGGKINKQKNHIYFDDTDMEEMFYEKYNLEPDEQSLECQMKSVLSFSKDDNDLRGCYVSDGCY